MWCDAVAGTCRQQLPCGYHSITMAGGTHSTMQRYSGSVAASTAQSPCCGMWCNADRDAPRRVVPAETPSGRTTQGDANALQQYPQWVTLSYATLLAVRCQKELQWFYPSKVLAGEWLATQTAGCSNNLEQWPWTHAAASDANRAAQRRMLPSESLCWRMTHDLASALLQDARMWVTTPPCTTLMHVVRCQSCPETNANLWKFEQENDGRLRKHCAAIPSVSHPDLGTTLVHAVQCQQSCPKTNATYCKSQQENGWQH